MAQTPTTTLSLNSSPTPSDIDTVQLTIPGPTPAISPSSQSTLATATPGLITATAVLEASIFVEPDVNSEELAYLEPGDEVILIAVTTNGAWLLVRNDRNIEGFVATSRVELPPEFNPPKVTPSPTLRFDLTPSVVTTFAPLNLDFWELIDTGRCEGEQWYKRIYIRGFGGDLNYTYYYFNDVDRDPQFLAERHDDSFTFEVSGTGNTALRLTGEVRSGNGLFTRRMIVIEPYQCP